MSAKHNSDDRNILTWISNPHNDKCLPMEVTIWTKEVCEKKQQNIFIFIFYKINQYFLIYKKTLKLSLSMQSDKSVKCRCHTRMPYAGHEDSWGQGGLGLPAFYTFDNFIVLRHAADDINPVRWIHRLCYLILIKLAFTGGQVASKYFL